MMPQFARKVVIRNITGAHHAKTSTAKNVVRGSALKASNLKTLMTYFELRFLVSQLYRHKIS